MRGSDRSVSTWEEVCTRNRYIKPCNVSSCNLAPVTDDTQLTIDELARNAGMTVRNVRAHQSRGLLPPPEIRGRTGFYGPEHVDRLEFIKDLQAEGFSLDVIKRILDRAPRASATEVLSFTRAVAEPFG